MKLYLFDGFKPKDMKEEIDKWQNQRVYFNDFIRIEDFDQEKCDNIGSEFDFEYLRAKYRIDQIKKSIERVRRNKNLKYIFAAFSHIGGLADVDFNEQTGKLTPDESTTIRNIYNKMKTIIKPNAIIIDYVDVNFKLQDGKTYKQIFAERLMMEKRNYQIFEFENEREYRPIMYDDDYINSDEYKKLIWEQNHIRMGYYDRNIPKKLVLIFESYKTVEFYKGYEDDIRF